jgi:hypothetical protein
VLTEPAFFKYLVEWKAAVDGRKIPAGLDPTGLLPLEEEKDIVEEDDDEAPELPGPAAFRQLEERVDAQRVEYGDEPLNIDIGGEAEEGRDRRPFQGFLAHTGLTPEQVQRLRAPLRASPGRRSDHLFAADSEDEEMTTRGTRGARGGRGRGRQARRT